MEQETSIQLLQRWREGDAAAADAIFERYVNRLCGLARSRLSGKMRRRVEAEDIVQSVYRSFFRKAGDQFVIERQGDLWRLLAAITINKVRGKVEFHSARKRGIDAETSLNTAADLIAVSPEAISGEPRPDEATAMVEELTNLVSELDSSRRAIIELSMQGLSLEEIADHVHRSPRTVRRAIQDFRDALQVRLEQSLSQSLDS